ncbi:hypothetical protein [Ferrovibrio sp.]|uniref:hypothetical protein n=1 Tax=Ferrovibrio sp. TaxID=1917215 RepID=UPI002626C851|nr:hypothetical protein [Ferrovibrio sp.]
MSVKPDLRQSPTFISCVGALLASTIVPTIAASVFFDLYLVSGIAAFAFAVAFSHAVLLGIPLFLLVQARGLFNFFSAVAGGFLIGILPLGILIFPINISGGSSSIDGVLMISDGLPTYAGWMGYFETILISGLFGALGGFAFWLTLKCSAARIRRHPASS